MGQYRLSMNILILFAHPAFHKSRVNKILINGLSEIEGVTFHDLYECYPEFNIDIKVEQKLLSEHDCIVFHYPFFWYSTPSILKEWQDLVLEHGWAYGKEGDALKGKLFFNTITTGGPKEVYQSGKGHHTIIELITPIIQTASICGMIKIPPFVIHGTHAIEKAEILDHRNDYFNILNIMAKGEFNMKRMVQYDYLNEYLKKVK